MNVPSSAKVANFVAFVGAMYSFYALYSSGEEAMLYGLPDLPRLTLYLGPRLSPRFELKNKHGDGAPGLQQRGSPSIFTLE